ncbi:MAG TPA: AMP-binding protein, partial [Gammaproteobacteria bacterium]
MESFAARRGNPAVVAFGAHGSATQDYGVLHDESRRVASGLLERGLGAGDMVLLWAPNSAAWVAAYFGIVGCGATAVPLDHQSTVERAVAVLKHSGAKLVFTVAAHAAALERAVDGAKIPCLLLDGDESDARSWQTLKPSSRQAPPPDAARIASLLYTSGTTGVPKAVPLTHGNLAANVSPLRDAKLIEAADVVLVPLPFHHVYPFTVGLLTVLATGARVVLPSGIS